MSGPEISVPSCSCLLRLREPDPTRVGLHQANCERRRAIWLKWAGQEPPRKDSHERPA